jgi:hypothetical protein
MLAIWDERLDEPTIEDCSRFGKIVPFNLKHRHEVSNPLRRFLKPHQHVAFIVPSPLRL